MRSEAEQAEASTFASWADFETFKSAQAQKFNAGAACSTDKKGGKKAAEKARREKEKVPETCMFDFLNTLESKQSSGSGSQAKTKTKEGAWTLNVVC